MRDVAFVAHNIRSTHNVGSLLRTADGLGMTHVYLTGYTPYPSHEHDQRLPHIANKLTRQIQKTSLGAEQRVAWSHHESFQDAVRSLRAEGYTVTAVEQAPQATKLHEFSPPERVALVLGSEVEGLSQSALQMCDAILEIPMFGTKESFNVAVAAGMAAYHCRFYRNMLQ